MQFNIRDPIHGTITFDEMEKRVIDHPIFQRLRYIHQLGLNYLVYPGANHDRFSHALGAMHVAGKLFDSILNNSTEVWNKHFSASDTAYFRRIIRLAALLHDLGHPPFSHMAERFMPQLSTLSIPQTWFESSAATEGSKSNDRQASHEDYSVLLIAKLADDESVGLSTEDVQNICSLVHHQIQPAKSWQEKYQNQAWLHDLLHSLISSELDADRMDYLLRDAHFTGVAYGQYDIEHLIANLGVVERPDSTLVRTIDATAVRAFEDFLLARYHMFLQVYTHKTPQMFEYFVAQARLNNEIDFVIPSLVDDYVKLRDSTVLERLFIASENPKNVWSRRFALRQPAKLALMVQNSNPEEKSLLDKTIAAFKSKNIPYFLNTTKQYLSKTQPFVGSGHSEMLVRRKVLGQFIYEPIEKYSSLLQKYNEVIDLSFLYVLPEYADCFEEVFKEAV